MKRFRLPVYLICMISIWMAGCAPTTVEDVPAAADVVEITYIKGDLETLYNASVTRTIRATRGALDELEIQLTGIEREDAQAEIDAVRPNGVPVTIWLTAEDITTTRAKIRVGIGDENISRAIHQEISERLNP